MRYLLLTIIMLCSLSSFSQERVFAGRVIDKEKKEGIAYGIVKVKDRNEGVYTDENGRFSFTAIPDSVKAFIISSLG